jgi:hypothetical protein
MNSASIDITVTRPIGRLANEDDLSRSPLQPIGFQLGATALGLSFDPFPQCGIDASLPAGTAGAQLLDHVVG